MERRGMLYMGRYYALLLGTGRFYSSIFTLHQWSDELRAWLPSRDMDREDLRAPSRAVSVGSRHLSVYRDESGFLVLGDYFANKLLRLVGRQDVQRKCSGDFRIVNAPLSEVLDSRALWLVLVECLAAELGCDKLANECLDLFHVVVSERTAQCS
jgi:hypothetical protein